MVDIKEVAENIYMIDDQLYSIPKWGSVYLINEDRKALIDSGPATSANTVLDGIKRISLKPEDIDYIIVTHIHLDHAGGAGVLLKTMPRAQVVVHQKGARHLVNPARLVSSMMQVRGEDAVIKHGEVVPVEPHRVKPVDEGDILELSKKQVLRFIDAPGHAPHELCIYESRNNGLFTGDAAGISVAGNEIPLPATQPPNFDLELYINTLERLMKLKATALYFAHFGVSNKVQKNLQAVVDRLRAWDDIVTGAIGKNGFSGAAARMMAQVCAELEPVRQAESLYEYLTKVNLPMCVTGYIEYYQKKHQAG